MPTGTHTLSDLLSVRFQSVVEFGIDRIVPVLQADLAVHNTLVTEMLTGLCDITTDQLRRYGTSVEGEMVEVDEFGRSPAQIVRPGATVGFPLRAFQYAIGWTQKWLESRTPADLATAVLTAQKAHMKAIQREIKRAIYSATNYTFADFLVENVELPVKAFVNGDGQGIPDGPNGEKFDGTTHTHYDAIAALDAASAKALIDDVIEHGFGGQVRVAVARADESTWRALTGFVPYTDPRVVVADNVNRATRPLDISRLDNRAIGVFEGAEIWVKPWAIPGYAFAWDNAAAAKPLAFRQRAGASLQGLRVAATNSAFPLHAQFMEAEFGIGVWTRTNGAVLYTGGAAYVNPSIN